MIKAKIDLICLFFRKQTVFQFHFQCFTTDHLRDSLSIEEI